METTGILILACRRPKHLRNLILSLENNPNFRKFGLTIAIGKPKEAQHVEQYEEVIKVVEGFRQEHKCDLLLSDEVRARCFIQNSISECFKVYSQLIVLEDDLQVHPSFLEFMVTALEKFKKTNIVSQISGWAFSHQHNSNEAYFSPMTSSWGWATWRDRWNEPHNDEENFEWLGANYRRIYRFNASELYDCFGMVRAIIRDSYDAWDPMWYLRQFRKERLSLVPPLPLVINRGFDGSGANFTSRFMWSSEEVPHAFSPQMPEVIELDQRWGIEKRSFKQWIVASESNIFWFSRLKRLIKNFCFVFFSRNLKH